VGVDPSLVRLAFVVGTLCGGIGMLVYLVLAILLPVDQEAPPHAALSAQRSHALAGMILVVLGTLLLAGNMGWARWLSWNLFWPVVLILPGAGLWHVVRGPPTYVEGWSKEALCLSLALLNPRWLRPTQLRARD
jgi:Domain of unknown function (DUF5668)/PspC domain